MLSLIRQQEDIFQIGERKNFTDKVLLFSHSLAFDLRKYPKSEKVPYPLSLGTGLAFNEMQFSFYLPPPASYRIVMDKSVSYRQGANIQHILFNIDQNFIKPSPFLK